MTHNQNSSYLIKQNSYLDWKLIYKLWNNVLNCILMSPTLTSNICNTMDFSCTNLVVPVLILILILIQMNLTLNA